MPSPAEACDVRLFFGLHRRVAPPRGPCPAMSARGDGSTDRHLLLGIAPVAVALAVALTLFVAPAPRSHRTAVFPGFTVEDANNPAGIVVTSVQTASAAANAGIEVGDRITAVNDQPVDSIKAARACLQHDQRPVIDMQVYHHQSPRYVRLFRSGNPSHDAQNPGRRG